MKGKIWLPVQTDPEVVESAMKLIAKALDLGIERDFDRDYEGHGYLARQTLDPDFYCLMLTFSSEAELTDYARRLHSAMLWLDAIEADAELDKENAERKRAS
jgi:hypothetical protein